MSSPFVGEIRVCPYNFAPRYWALCNGQLISIASNTALFSLLGTTFGGDGRTTFALPNFQGRAAVHRGQGPGLSLYDLGQAGGTATVTLTTAQIPAHSHVPQVDTAGGGINTPVAGAYWGTVGRGKPAPYGAAAALVPMSAVTSTVGSSVAHNNLSPYLTLNFIIALAGIYPSRP